MNTTQNLLPLLTEWRRLTELEGKAVDIENWEEVARHQRNKRQIRDQMEAAFPEAHENDSNSPGTCLNQDPKLDQIVADLVALETKNLGLLNGKRESKQAELARANESVRNVQGVRRAYAGPNASHWQSYS